MNELKEVARAKLQDSGAKIDDEAFELFWFFFSNFINRELCTAAETAYNAGKDHMRKWVYISFGATICSVFCYVVRPILATL